MAGIKATEAAEEKKWQAQMDARTLADGQVITDDPKRLAAASKEAGAIAKERQEEADALRQIEKLYSQTPELHKK